MLFGEDVDDRAALQRLDEMPWQDVATRISLYRNYFARQNRLPSGEKKLKDPPKYLIVIESPSGLDVSHIDGGDVTVAQFKILKAFGDKISFYQ
jgi:hypothetical protein